MKRTMRTLRPRALLGAILLILMAIAALSPLAVRAESRAKTVRVGWHEAPYFITDQYGRRSGYSYEYQWKLAAYTGWNYEYVEGTWSELLQMLKDGKIDLLSDVSFMPERADSMLFPALPMGTEAYYIFATPNNAEISPDDFSTLSGKKIGVTDTIIQKDMFIQGARQHGVEAKLISLTTPR